MRCFVVSAVWLQACCVPLPFPHDHDTTDTIGSVDDDRPVDAPVDTARPESTPYDTSPPTDTAGDCPLGLYVGPTLVNAGSLTCTPNEATLSANLLGWASEAVLFVQETGSDTGQQWSEEHPLHIDLRDQCGFEEDRRQTLDALGVSPEDWIPGDTSVFPCDGFLNDPAMITVAIYVEDVDDGAGDCLAFGDDAAGLVAGAYDDERVGAEPSFDLGACVIAGR